ncbi:MAG: hypothetical protein JWP87_4705 [Labilithrix sp.]|nr:hypothetical protein [Labilithrix sp.]
MTARITMQTLLGALAERGLDEKPSALRALRATLAVVGEHLVADEAKALAEAMPEELAGLIEDQYDSDFSEHELFDRIGRRERARPSRAREEAEIVLAVLGECLSDDRRRRIARGLPGLAGELMRGERELGEPPPHREASHAPEPTTLASSRPGSMHPVSESAPPSGHAESVARNPSPHADTKLSGAKGLTQERLEETLATGKPR